MEFQDKERAIQELIKENFENCRVGNLVRYDGQITVYFEDVKENWIVDFVGIWSQIGFKFLPLSINTLSTGEDIRFSVTLIFDIENLDESDFW